MKNFFIYFSNPWLLLLIIPAIALTLIPYFRLSKKYRKTRNRITSMVLHCIVMVLAISVLAGIQFRYQIPNSENEVLFLVDVSDTQTEAEDSRNEFLKIALGDAEDGNIKVGVVTFGFDCVYAVPITDDIQSIYDSYLLAELPDTSATDIAAALEYAKDLFDNPETAKIVLVTDGKETDENALASIRLVSARGTKVDVAYLKSGYDGYDLQITGVQMPEVNISDNEEFTFSVTLNSSQAANAKLTFSDNGSIDPVNGVKSLELTGGAQTISFTHTFESKGLHKMTFEIIGEKENIEVNNTYISYFNLENFNNILILERYTGQSENLMSILTADNEYNVTVANMLSGKNLPASVDDLRMYDQVILNNVSNGDLKNYMVEGFDKMLQSYVSDFGGGLFTVGGNDPDTGKAHSYSREDMYGSTLQELLPVQAINYTPPAGIMIVIDRSGSMSENDALATAREGANACLTAMTERDYVGIMTLDSDYNTILPLTPCTRQQKIQDAIASIIKTDGGTNFQNAIHRAALALRGLKSVEKRHIILVTDGLPGGNEEDYLNPIKDYYENDKITLSMVLINVEKDSATHLKMKEATDLGHGQAYAGMNPNELIRNMRDDINSKAIKEVEIPEGGFQPTVYNSISPVVKNIERDEDSLNGRKLTVNLKGFYGTKIRKSDYLVLTGDYDVPLYAQWKYGKGSVGSFMCDLSGNWSSEFLSNNNGKNLVRNIVKNILPTENIKPKEINADLKSDNYMNYLSVYGGLNDGESIKAHIQTADENAQVLADFGAVSEDTNGDCYVTVAMTKENNYSRCNFVLKRSGLYKIVIIKLDADGNELARYEIFKEFSYSKEYDVTLQANEADYRNNLDRIAANGNGVVIANLKDPVEVYQNFVDAFDRVFDPRIVFIIIAIVLFLLDIAVRKFKFKWLHEIIRDRKSQKK